MVPEGDGEYPRQADFISETRKGAEKNDEEYLSVFHLVVFKDG